MSGTGTSRFPEDFLWGAATSAYQVEGSPLADGAGPSNWHRFSHQTGNVFDDQNGDIACDQYRRFADDISLMQELGLGAYRFSLAWSRILPSGTGAVNHAGLDHYARLVDLLLESAITPCVTLHHWDLPTAIEDRGGWLNRDHVERFAEYAQVVFRALGDRVPLWVTINEPWVIADAGYLHGTHPPGHRSPAEMAKAAHHLLLAHAEAVRVCRSETAAKIGLVVNLEPKDPASDSAADLAATDRADASMNRLYLDPIFLGRYPEVMEEALGDQWMEPSDEDMRKIREPIDFLGINYYTRGVTCEDQQSLPWRARTVVPVTAPRTELGWEVHPPSLGRVLRWVKDRYGAIPLYITENGAAYDDPEEPVEGRVDDPLRCDYMRFHLRVVHAALLDGVNLRGYFAWSLLDNFEWAHGYSIRFGIVHVDYRTQRRTLKTSAHLYRRVIESRGAALYQSGGGHEVSATK
jgi:beta-glucosidase